MKKQVDNFNLIRKHLKWENEHDYYYCQLILRKKDKTTSYGNKNNSARLIKAYYFYNIDQFNEKEKEIKGMCDFHKCRAGISLNRRNNVSTLHELLKQVTDRIVSKNYLGVNHIISSVNGEKTSRDKIWLVDIDNPEDLNVVKQTIKQLQPYDREKIIEVLPTYTGYHLMTTRFDSDIFESEMQRMGLDVVIHKNNPFCLYYPKIEIDE